MSALPMSAEEAIFTHVESAIRSVLHTKPGQIALDTGLTSDLGAESLDFLDISCEIEKLADVELDFKELYKARRAAAGNTSADLTVRDIVEYLKARTG